MRYDPTSLKWGVVTQDQQLIAAFDSQDAATAFKKASEERGQHEDLQVYDFENDEVVAKQLEPAGDRIQG